MQKINQELNGKLGGRDFYAQGKIVGTKADILKYFGD